MMICIYDALMINTNDTRRDKNPRKQVIANLSRRFSMNKHELNEYLMMLQETNAIKIRKMGIELNYEVINDK